MANTTAAGGEGPRKASGSLPTPDMSKGPKRFLSEVGREMRKVTWPTRAETNRLTGVVLAVCGIVVALLTAMSFVFDTLVKIITQSGGG